MEGGGAGEGPGEGADHWVVGDGVVVRVVVGGGGSHALLLGQVEGAALLVLVGGGPQELGQGHRVVPQLLVDHLINKRKS